MEFAITQPFFELQTPDFAWKFVWTVPSKWASMQRKICLEINARTIPWTMELTITQPFLEREIQILHGILYKPSKKVGHP